MPKTEAGRWTRVVSFISDQGTNTDVMAVNKMLEEINAFQA